MPIQNLSESIQHGGDILSASKNSGIPINNWIDLSTGVSPYCYPTDPLPQETFSKLPYISDEFNDLVRNYYQADNFVAVPGTQVAIQLIPKLLPPLPILLPSVGYQEHKHAWQKTGNKLNYYQALDDKSAFDDIELAITKEPKQHLVIINPNNPSTLRFSPLQLLDWAEKIAGDAYLIIDEAFIDTNPSQSIVPLLSQYSASNIIVLRSFGKFFGLAGIRLGFVFSTGAILKDIADHIPVWSINGPALYLASLALPNTKWQAKHQQKLLESERSTRALFEGIDGELCFHHRLFSSYLLSKKRAQVVFKKFYDCGILLRIIEVSDKKAILRVGRIQAEDIHAKHTISSILNGSCT